MIFKLPFFRMFLKVTVAVLSASTLTVFGCWVSYLSSSLGTSDYSEATAREIDMEVRKIIESSHEETKKLLQDHEQILIGLATKLLEQETMDGEEMQKFIEEHNK